MGKGHLTGPRGVAATDEADIRNGVMGRTKRALGNEGPVALQYSHDTVYLGCFDGLIKGHAGQDPGNTPGKHSLSGTGRTDQQDVRARNNHDFMIS